MKKSKFRKNVYVFIIIVCVLGIISSAIYLINYKYNKVKEDNLIESLQSKRQIEKEDAIYENEEESEQSPEESKINETNKIADEDLEQEEVVEKQILEEYIELHEENNDMYGWINIQDENIEYPINYPVMFTPNEPNFYENKNWKKEICKFGTSIWIDGRTTDETENIIVYGHNMKDLSMFGALRYYKEESYYKEHKYIQFDTLYEKQTYEIIAVSKAIVYYEKNSFLYVADPPEGAYLFYEHMELDSEEEFNSYIDNAKQNAWFDIDVTAEYGDQLITLCTCDYWTKNARLIIIAKKI